MNVDETHAAGEPRDRVSQALFQTLLVFQVLASRDQ